MSDSTERDESSESQRDSDDEQRRRRKQVEQIRSEAADAIKPKKTEPASAERGQDK